jgi:hypothetical protein
MHTYNIGVGKNEQKNNTCFSVGKAGGIKLSCNKKFKKKENSNASTTRYL